MSTVVEQGNTFIIVSQLSDCQLKRKVVARHVVDTWGWSALLRRSETGRHIVIRLLVTAALREVFGSASFAGMPIEWLKNYTVPMLSQVPGGLLAAGIVAAVVQKIWPAKIQGHGVAFAAAGIEDEEAGK